MTRVRPTWARLAVGVLAIGVSCATGFQRPSLSSLTLGQTTKESVLRTYGNPERTRDGFQNDQPITSLEYVSATRHITGQIELKVYSFAFVEDRLVGFSFASTSPGEQRDLSPTATSEIKKGTTTKAQVLARFGQPSSAWLYPAMLEDDAEEGDSALQYVSVVPAPVMGAPMTTKTLRITFNAKDVVKGVGYTETGTTVQPVSHSR